MLKKLKQMLPSQNPPLSNYLNPQQIQELAVPSPSQHNMDSRSYNQEKCTFESSPNCSYQKPEQKSIMNIERNMDAKKDQVYSNVQHSLSFVNILFTFCVWAFLIIAIFNKDTSKFLLWVIFAVAYIIYIVECMNCSLFSSLTSRKFQKEDLATFLNQYLSISPQIVYQINKLVQHKLINGEILNSQVANDLESQDGQKQAQPEVQESQQENKQKMAIRFEQSTLVFEFEKMHNEFLSVENLLGTYDSFFLNINTFSKMSNDFSLESWNQRKEQFKVQQGEVKAQQMISTVEYTQLIEGQSIFFMKSLMKYYLMITLYSIFSLLGLSVVFRFFFNISIPTINAKLEKNLTA